MAHPIVDYELTESHTTQLLLQKHCDYLVAFKDTDDCTLDFMKLSGIFWTLTALDLMNELHRVDKDAIIELVMECQQPDGGFSPAPNHDSHLLSTLSGIQVLALFGRLDAMNVESAVDFVLGLQQSDGSFFGDKWGEIDTRFSFCAIASLAILNKLEECAQSGRLNKDACGKYLERCQNLDGGFGTRPGSESHAGQAYCVIGALALLREVRRLDLDGAVWWLSERQLPSGGINGRPEKHPDVCYSWWTLASLAMLDKLKWINGRRLLRFILASQDSETGGIADRPGDMPDPFHTLFGLAGLSLIAQSPENEPEPSTGSSQTTDDQSNGHGVYDDVLSLAKSQLKKINPALCMPQDLIDRMGLRIQQIRA